MDRFFCLCAVWCYIRVNSGMALSVHWGIHLRACKTHETREVGTALSDSIKISVLDS